MTSLPASLIVHTNDDSKHIAGMNTVWVAPETAKSRKPERKEYGYGSSTSITSSW